MKNKIFLNLVILLIPLVLIAQVGIGTADPHPSAIQEIKSTTGGFLLPRMNLEQMNTIQTPAKGLMIYCTDCGHGDVMVFNTKWSSLSDHNNVYGKDGKPYKELISSSSGRTWLDRNIGATRAAISDTDHLAYGSLFQWGRGADGHELMNWDNATAGTPNSGSNYESTQSSTDDPDHDLYILSINPINQFEDWRNPSNDDLWQGVNGINNPCPLGFRVPTKDEFAAETDILNDLNLTYSGYRNQPYGSLINPSSEARYWSSSIVNGKVIYLSLNSPNQNSIDEDVYRVTGFSVRCIKGQSEENTD